MPRNVYRRYKFKFQTPLELKSVPTVNLPRGILPLPEPLSIVSFSFLYKYFISIKDFHTFKFKSYRFPFKGTKTHCYLNCFSLLCQHNFHPSMLPVLLCQSCFLSLLSKNTARFTTPFPNFPLILSTAASSFSSFS